ncbi:MAG TPA: hypothetical protein VHS59_09020 [Bacillota bacterium]|nr:hypothetical protein [Bacillota bacterium]
MRRSFTLLAAVFFAVSILAVGCTKNQAPIPAPKPPEQAKNENNKPVPKPAETETTPADYFPITQGMTWEYEGEGNEYASFTRKVVFAADDKGQLREDNGGTVSAAVFKTTKDSVTRIFFMGEAYGEKNYLQEKPNENIIIIKAPLKVGTKWEEPNGTREIVDVAASVYTPYGSFNDCLRIKITAKDSTLYEYYKKGVGLLKREFISGETTVTSRLKSVK